MPKFPSCFPDNFAEEILPKEATEEAHLGYRVAKYGLDVPASFVSTYEERIIEGKPVGRLKANLFSTSLFDSPEYIKHILSITMQDDEHPKPKACIVKGFTDPSCGPSLVGEYKPRKTRNGPVYCRHIDWWIYEDARPWEYFEKVGDD